MSLLELHSIEFHSLFSYFDLHHIQLIPTRFDLIGCWQSVDFVKSICCGLNFADFDSIDWMLKMQSSGDNSFDFDQTKIQKI